MIPLASLLLAAPPSAGPEPAQHPALLLGHTETLHSDVLGEDRELFVYLPNGYSEARRYPLLVLLDGQSNIKLTAGILHGLAESGVIPRTIVCGVANTDRWRDLTPWPLAEFPGSGGGPAFLRFLEEELLPHADERWSTSGFRTLCGHSLGGLTALQAIVAIPGAFDAYIALSPTLDWGDGRMIGEVLATFEQPARVPRHLYLALADERLERPYFDELVRRLEGEAPEALDWESQLFPNDDHGSIRVSGALAGLRSVYADWWLPSRAIVERSAAEIEEALARAARKYEQPRVLGLMEVTNAGYWAIADPAHVERGFELFHEALERWPDDPYPYACIGEGCERTGRLEEALTWMERAMDRIANDRLGDRAYYESMLLRVRNTVSHTSPPSDDSTEPRDNP